MKWMKGILATALAIILGLSVYLNIRDKILLDSCSKTVEGQILNLKKLRNRGYSAKITYAIDSKVYTRHPYVGRPHPYFVGDTVLVEYACKDPKTIRIRKKEN